MLAQNVITYTFCRNGENSLVDGWDPAHSGRAQPPEAHPDLMLRHDSSSAFGQ